MISRGSFHAFEQLRGYNELYTYTIMLMTLNNLKKLLFDSFLAIFAFRCLTPLVHLLSCLKLAETSNANTG